MEMDGVIQETQELPGVGVYIGQCKWFSDSLGYGFVTIQKGEDAGKDIFVHHSGIRPLNSNYKTLKKGEYIQFNIIDGNNGLQAVDITGIAGGTLMCDVSLSTKPMVATRPPRVFDPSKVRGVRGPPPPPPPQE